MRGRAEAVQMVADGFGAVVDAFRPRSAGMPRVPEPGNTTPPASLLCPRTQAGGGVGGDGRAPGKDRVDR
jgi:hypothetical protein